MPGVAGQDLSFQPHLSFLSSQLSSMQLRRYQEKCVCLVEAGNTVVLLPTGAGKTLIAAEAMRRVGGRSLFLVPTCLLVEQQARAVREWNPGQNVCEFMGGKALPPSTFHVLVTTPKAFQTAQARGDLHLAWSSFNLVIFDEVKECGLLAHKAAPSPTLSYTVPLRSVVCCTNSRYLKSLPSLTG